MTLTGTSPSSSYLIHGITFSTGVYFLKFCHWLEKFNLTLFSPEPLAAPLSTLHPSFPWFVPEMSVFSKVLLRSSAQHVHASPAFNFSPRGGLSDTRTSRLLCARILQPEPPDSSGSPRLLCQHVRHTPKPELAQLGPAPLPSSRSLARTLGVTLVSCSPAPLPNGPRDQPLFPPPHWPSGTFSLLSVPAMSAPSKRSPSSSPHQPLSPLPRPATAHPVHPAHGPRRPFAARCGLATAHGTVSASFRSCLCPSRSNSADPQTVPRTQDTLIMRCSRSCLSSARECFLLPAELPAPTQLSPLPSHATAAKASPGVCVRGRELPRACICACLP